MANFSFMFIENYSSITEELTKLLLSICNNLRSQAHSCIERIRLKLKGFYYTVEDIHCASNSSD